MRNARALTTLSRLLAVLGVGIAAAILIFAQVRSHPRISGADPSYQYAALGLRAVGERDLYAHALNGAAVLYLFYAPGRYLPPDWNIGFAMPHGVTLAARAGGVARSVCAEFYAGGYLQGFHLADVLGRLPAAQAQLQLRPSIVLSQALAHALFGQAHAALGQIIEAGKDIPVPVAAVIGGPFHGTSRCAGGGLPQAWLPYTSRPQVLGYATHPPKSFHSGQVDFSGVAPLLSVPAGLPKTGITTELQHLFFLQFHGHFKRARGYAVSFPYAQSVSSLRSQLGRLRLTLAAVLLLLEAAVLNMVVVRWHAALQMRSRWALEHILGARRRWQLRQLLGRSLLALAWMLPACLLVAVAVLALIVHLTGLQVSAASFIAAGGYLLLPVVAAFAVAILVAEALPMLWMLYQPRVAWGKSGTAFVAGERHWRRLFVFAEVLLAAAISVLAAWTVHVALQDRYGDLGFLDRSVTLVSMHASERSVAASNTTSNKDEVLWLSAVLDAARGVAAHEPVGMGPALGAHASASELGSRRRVSTARAQVSACQMTFTPGWLQAVGGHVLAGDNFTAGLAAAPHARLLDVQAAAALGDGRAQTMVGRTIKIHRTHRIDVRHVIGVIVPLHLAGVTGPRCPTVYADLSGEPWNAWQAGDTLAIGGHLTAGQRAALVQRLRSINRQDHTGMHIGAVRSGTQARIWLMGPLLQQTELMAAAAIAAWLIALSGIFALLRVELARQRQLLAIQSALGAGPRRQYTGVVLGALALAVAAVVLALLFTPWLAQQFALLSGAQVAPYGWPTWVALAVLLLAVFLVAHFPARRAARAEPAESLHEL